MLAGGLGEDHFVEICFIRISCETSSELFFQKFDFNKRCKNEIEDGKKKNKSPRDHSPALELI